jgi:putative flippase GtrA
VSALIRRLIRYGSVSAVSTTVSLSVLGLLVAGRVMALGWANVVATAAGTVPSFELNRRWVWNKTGSRSVATEIVPFCALSFVGLALSTLAVAVVGLWADHAAVTTTTRTLAIEGANVSAFGLVWLGQFVLLDRVLFRQPA